MLCATQASAQTGGTPGDSSRGAPSGSDSTHPVPGRIRVIDTTDIRYRLDSISVLHEEIRSDHAVWRAYLDSLENTPQAVMARNLAMTPEDWKPTAADRNRREEDIKRSQNAGDLFKNHYVPLVSAPLAAIGRMLGLIEDVTPRIKYTLNGTRPVTVKIYTLTAEPVVTLVEGSQPPGVYSFDWDLLDAAGRRVVYGDYIAEVIVDKVLVLRKRIEVP
jgi:hypothetical protein